MEPSAVCFGAKGNSYGSFKILVPGRIITFKLIYLNGRVTCDERIPGVESKWGCKHSHLSTYTMGTHITDFNKTRLLPKEEYLWEREGCLRKYYSLPWATPDSKELLFDNLSVPLAVTTNQEFQVWFVEDLYNCGASDNGPEKTCAEVHGLYVWSAMDVPFSRPHL